MLYYKRVADDLWQAEKTIKAVLRANADSNTDKAALEESLSFVQQAREKCRLAQEKSMCAMLAQEMKMQ
uniref:hypothetical protein n=1 Tax=Enterocloster clostridioformis TaxID=1531 RepID=UPI0026EE996C|nr:hypothetical protein [Enterocloster clostridioformis]